MCNNCNCYGGNSFLWIILILIILFACGGAGCGGNCGGGGGCGGNCGCNNDCGCC